MNTVELKKLNSIYTDSGSVFHFIKNTDTDFLVFGECYISEILPGAIKAWKLHSLQTQNLTCIFGEIEVVTYDPSEGNDNGVSSFIINNNSKYSKIIIPPNIWYGFRNLSDHLSLILNITDIPHDPSESSKIAYDSSKIPFKW